MSNFVVAQLCDNDFGSKLEAALQKGFAIKQSAPNNLNTEDCWMRFIIASVIGQCIENSWDCQKEAIDWNRAKNLEYYFEKRLNISITSKPPMDDNDGGSACIDLNTGHSWTY